MMKVWTIIHNAVANKNAQNAIAIKHKYYELAPLAARLEIKWNKCISWQKTEQREKNPITWLDIRKENNCR